MLTKTILFTIIAACGIPPGPATSPDDLERDPPDKIERGYIFCCHDINNGAGEGCVTIGEKKIDSCSTVLACDTFEKKDGIVTCT